jgi:tetratricopeptide (TPR) repeat protein
VLTHSRETMVKLDALFQQEKFAEAIVLCDELEKAMPDVTHVHAYRAYTLGQLKRVKESIAEYELAVKDGYPTGVVYYNLALLLENGKNYQRALDMYLAAAELDPGLAHARSQRSSWRWRCGSIRSRSNWARSCSRKIRWMLSSGPGSPGWR